MKSRKEIISVPETLSRQKISERLSQGLIGYSENERLFYSELLGIVESPEFIHQVQNGEITFAMIKPNLVEAVPKDLSLGQFDHELEEVIIKTIRQPLTVITSFSFMFTPEMISKFYEGSPKNVQLGIPPIDRHRYGGNHANRWEESVALMTIGPATALILYSSSGNAVAEWRTQMGLTWNVQEARRIAPGSIRAVYGMEDSHNNIVHGSDSPQAVLRELDLILTSLSQT